MPQGRTSLSRFICFAFFNFLNNPHYRVYYAGERAYTSCFDAGGAAWLRHNCRLFVAGPGDQETERGGRAPGRGVGGFEQTPAGEVSRTGGGSPPGKGGRGTQPGSW